MDKHLFTPPHYAKIKDWTPLIFLAGPVQGAPDYQTRFAEFLLEKRDDVAVASPRRTPEDQEQFDADEQVEWELRHRFRARGLGVTAIWFAAQDISIPYPGGRAYGQTTRIELGETLGWWDIKRPREKVPYAKLVVGFDPQYSPNGGGSEGYIRRTLKYRGLPVYDDDNEFLDAIVDELP
ncbi:MAG: hypothetical protein ACXWJB_15090 [Limisphaerales bacterium]